MEGMPRAKRFAVVYWATCGSLLAAFFGFSRWIAPRLIRSAYEGTSHPFLNRVIAGRAQHPVEHYLDAWKDLAGRSAVIFVVAVAIVYGVGVFLRSSRGRTAARSMLRSLRRTSGDTRAQLASTLQLSAIGQVSVAVCLGLLSGLCEVVYRTGHYRITGQIPIEGWSASTGIWMVPLADAGLFALVAVLLVLGARRWPTLSALPVPVFLFTLLGLYALLRAPAVRLHGAAALVLSIGVAARLAHAALHRPTPWFRRIRRGAYGLTGAVGALCLMLILGTRLAERRALARLADAPADAPNLLLIILDTVRASSLGLYGHERPTTPRLDRIADSGIVFDRATATSPWTLPSIATLFTGRYRSELSVSWRASLDDAAPTLSEVLAEHGYVTAGFVANLLYSHRQSGLGRGFLHYEDHPVSWGTFFNNSWLLRAGDRWVRRAFGNHEVPLQKRAEQVNAEFLGWLAATERRPFFAYLNYFDAHNPYRPPSPFNRRFADAPRYWTSPDLTLEVLPEVELAYDNSLAYLDDQIGRLFDALEATGVLDTTWVIILSDHGEQFGAHGFAGHGNTLYRQLLHVPLIVLPPAGLRSEPLRRGRVGEPVTLRDIPATIAELAGIGGRHPFSGESLSTHWAPGVEQERTGVTPAPARTGSPILAQADGRPARSPLIATRNGPLESLVRGRLHYIRAGDGGEELYDVVRDPEEAHDLSESAQHRSDLRELRTALDSVLAELSGEPR